MESVDCNLCGSRDLRPVYRVPDRKYYPDEWFTVVECTQCGLGFVNPRPTAAEIGKYYPKTFYDDFREHREYHERRYAIEASYLEGVEARSGLPRLLDVGCANGDFPRFMCARGWAVEGVEISSSAETIADFKVYRQQFPSIPPDAPRYDAITAWAVLEHVHDPMAHFRKAAAVLEAGGRFVFLVTNFRSLGSRALFLEDVPRHLYFFTEATVRRYLRAAGLELERADYGASIYQCTPVNWLRHYLYRLAGSKLTWETLPSQKCRACRADIRTESRLRYSFLHRHAFLDRLERLLTPWYVRAQMLARTYGIVTYVARKPQVSVDRKPQVS